jgi:hypothetical protein
LEHTIRDTFVATHLDVTRKRVVCVFQVAGNGSVMLSYSYPCTDITLLALCYSNMLHPSKDNLQGVRLIHCHSVGNNMCTRCRIQIIEQCVLCEFHVCRVAEYKLLSKLNVTSGTHFMDLAVKMYQSSFLMMALSGPKHVGGNHINVH